MMLFYCLQAVGKYINAELIVYYEDYERHLEREDFSVEEALAVADRHTTLLPEVTEDLSKYIIFNSTVSKRDESYFAVRHRVCQRRLNRLSRIDILQQLISLYIC